MLNVGPASPVLANIHSVLVSASWCQSWVNVGPPSVMLAHIQRGTKQTRYPNTGLILAQRRRRWANISPAKGQRLVFDRLHIESAGDK